MIRYLISFPPEAKVTQRDLEMVRELIKHAVEGRNWRDIVMNMGGTITDMRPKRSKVWVKNVQRRLR
jgi:hypothetical protein